MLHPGQTAHDSPGTRKRFRHDPFADAREARLNQLPLSKLVEPDREPLLEAG
jgi:hypothetical protein